MGKTPTSYVLCSNPRSGTTLLCDMIEQTAVAGRPNSFFREKSLADWADHWGIRGDVDVHNASFNAAYFEAMRTEGFGGTPLFGLRLMGPDLAFASDWLSRLYPEAPNDLARLEAAFGPLGFIHLARHDKLAEAVSYVRAEQTGLWHQNADGSDMERIAPTGARGFDADAIRERLDMLRAFEKDWDTWFAREGIEPLRLTYDALAEQPQNGLAQVLKHIGCDPGLAQSVTPRLRKLADQTNAQWIAKYRALHPAS